ncbi:MAG TPA: O-acetyl-ADP-ribose deacetylase [Vicinamibacteria bacterium]|jgi:O-acetyl-ADP-ribose deacetylase (regulator of RNase III)|nr:O-acetyl-ADP-ribose deacetylase [Vicinamibacteria bacterium]
MTTRVFGRTRVELVRGDITREGVDAIVNAANSSLMGGGGVDGAIHRTGGPAILEDCRRIREERGPLPAGEAVVTRPGQLPCRHVIHTVGPVWEGGGAGEPETLAGCYRSCLALAQSQGFTSLAFPSISTGAFGYPVRAAAAVALRAAQEVLGAGSPLELVRFVLFSDADLAAYGAALEAL